MSLEGRPPSDLDSIRQTQLQKYKNEALAEVTTVTTGRVSHKDATQMVPVSNVQASSLTPNFDQIRGFFLTGHQKHPRFTDYLSAEEIGNLVNKTADQVRDPIKKYVNGLGHELPQRADPEAHQGSRWVLQGNRDFPRQGEPPGLQHRRRRHDDVVRDGGRQKFVWRNYWHPDVVKGVLTSRVPDRKRASGPEKFREHNPSTK